jgi:L-fucose isomerase-like protein
MAIHKNLTFGVIIGNRSFFPDSLADQGYQKVKQVLKQQGIATIILSQDQTKFGAVETFADAKKCATLFKAHADEIDGILVTLPNFGDEKGVLEAVRRSELNVPILIHAEPDEPDKMNIEGRRDSFCGKISVCNNLNQASIPYSLTGLHTVKLESDDFNKDLESFGAVCRIVKGLRYARFGAIGARPAAFNTVRYSEKLLEQVGISVETVDLSELIGHANRLSDDDEVVKSKLQSIQDYTSTKTIPTLSTQRLARFGVAVDSWVVQNEIDATAIQCWTSIQENFGICSCTQMSMMSENLLPSACEVDVLGVLSMYILQLASGMPSALLDWNNNYKDDPNKCVCFHCSNLPKSFFDTHQMDYHQIISGMMDKDKTYGSIQGRIKESPVSYLRLTTDDAQGEIFGYLGQGDFTKDSLETFGGYGVMHIPHMQSLLQFICKMGYEHHVAVNLSRTAESIHEALTTYLGWDIYHHVRGE